MNYNVLGYDLCGAEVQGTSKQHKQNLSPLFSL